MDVEISDTEYDMSEIPILSPVQEEAVEVVQEEHVEVVQEEAVEVVQEEPVEVVQDEPVEVVQDEPVEVVQDEPVEVVQEDAVEVVQDEPVEVVQEEALGMSEEALDECFNVDNIDIEVEIQKRVDSAVNTLEYEYQKEIETIELEHAAEIANLENQIIASHEKSNTVLGTEEYRKKTADKISEMYNKTYAMRTIEDSLRSQLVEMKAENVSMKSQIDEITVNADMKVRNIESILASVSQKANICIPQLEKELEHSKSLLEKEKEMHQKTTQKLIGFGNERARLNKSIGVMRSSVSTTIASHDIVINSQETEIASLQNKCKRVEKELEKSRDNIQKMREYCENMEVKYNVRGKEHFVEDVRILNEKVATLESNLLEETTEYTKSHKQLCDMTNKFIEATNQINKLTQNKQNQTIEYETRVNDLIKTQKETHKDLIEKIAESVRQINIGTNKYFVLEKEYNKFKTDTNDTVKSDTFHLTEKLKMCSNKILRLAKNCQILKKKAEYYEKLANKMIEERDTLVRQKVDISSIISKERNRISVQYADTITTLRKNLHMYEAKSNELQTLVKTLKSHISALEFEKIHLVNHENATVNELKEYIEELHNHRDNLQNEAVEGREALQKLPGIKDKFVALVAENKRLLEQTKRLVSTVGREKLIETIKELKEELRKKSSNPYDSRIKRMRDELIIALKERDQENDVLTKGNTHLLKEVKTCAHLLKEKNTVIDILKSSVKNLESEQTEFIKKKNDRISELESILTKALSKHVSK